jgi:hypothetical protein
VGDTGARKAGWSGGPATSTRQRRKPHTYSIWTEAASSPAGRMNLSSSTR